MFSTGVLVLHRSGIVGVLIKVSGHNIFGNDKLGKVLITTPEKQPVFEWMPFSSLKKVNK